MEPAGHPRGAEPAPAAAVNTLYPASLLRALYRRRVVMIGCIVSSTVLGTRRARLLL